MMEEKYHLKRQDSNIDLYDINLDFLSELDYNQIRNLSEKDLKWLLYIFVCQDKKLKNNLYNKNRMMNKVEKKMENFMKEFDSLLYYNHDEFRASEIEELKQDAYKEGRKEGMEQGVKQNSIKIAKKMLSKNRSIEEIQEFTDLTMKEIEEL